MSIVDFHRDLPACRLQKHCGPEEPVVSGETSRPVLNPSRSGDLHSCDRSSFDLCSVCVVVVLCVGARGSGQSKAKHAGPDLFSSDRFRGAAPLRAQMLQSDVHAQDVPSLVQVDFADARQAEHARISNAACLWSPKLHASGLRTSEMVRSGNV